jgi:hypothetical protein
MLLTGKAQTAPGSCSTKKISVGKMMMASVVVTAVAKVTGIRAAVKASCKKFVFSFIDYSPRKRMVFRNCVFIKHDKVQQ